MFLLLADARTCKNMNTPAGLDCSARGRIWDQSKNHVQYVYMYISMYYMYIGVYAYLYIVCTCIHVDIYVLHVYSMYVYTCI